MNKISEPGRSIQCPNCRQPFAVNVEQVIDVGRDPAAKTRLLAGQVNVARCPHCGYQAALGAPLLYHDPAHELLLTFVPMELGMKKDEQERVIGNLVRGLMNSIPAEQRRGYLFQPRTVLTMQGLFEAILAADGVTPEMLEAQRVKLRLAETLLQSDLEQLPELVKQNDERIDMEMFEIITAAAENALRSGRQDLAQHALQIRDEVMSLSTAGQKALADAESQEKAIQAVVDAVQALGAEAELDDFVDLVIRLSEDERQLDAVVGLQYPVMDYRFFQALTSRVDQASGDEQKRLAAVRNRITELIEMIRQQQEAAAQEAVQVLQDILGAASVEEGIQRNAGRINDTFMMVLAANIQAAEERKDLMASARLKQVREAVMKLVQSSAPPELQFVSSLLQRESLEEAQKLLDAQGGQYGPAILDLMDALLEDLEARGETRISERLQALRTYAAGVVGEPTS